MICIYDINIFSFCEIFISTIVIIILTFVSIHIRIKYIRKGEIEMPRKPSLDGKDSSLRIRMTAEDKERLVSYAERHYQTMSGVICQALDLLYAQEEAKDRPS